MDPERMELFLSTLEQMLQDDDKRDAVVHGFVLYFETIKSFGDSNSAVVARLQRVTQKVRMVAESKEFKNRSE